MINLFRRARQIVSVAYREWIRPFLPPRYRRYAGIPVALGGKWGDGLVSKLLIIFDGDEPTYEETLVKAVNETVRPEDRIVIVGGGVGVTVAIAAKLTGPTGSVMCFEGGKNETDLVRDTVALNGVDDRVTIIHSIVGAASHVYGSAEGAMRLPPSALPDCDVLELDCEGSETDILSRMTIRPRTILVETHGFYGSTTASCKQMLENFGYQVSELGLAEPRLADFCERNDIRVLSGYLPESAR
jgi:hypothetical protein